MTPISSHTTGSNSAPAIVGRTPQWQGDRQTDKTLSFATSLSDQDYPASNSRRAVDVDQSEAVARPLPSGASVTWADGNIMPGTQAAAGFILLQAQENSNFIALNAEEVDLSGVKPTGDTSMSDDVVPAGNYWGRGASSGQGDQGLFARQDDASRGQ